MLTSRPAHGRPALYLVFRIAKTQSLTRRSAVHHRTMRRQHKPFGGITKPFYRLWRVGYFPYPGRNNNLATPPKSRGGQKQGLKSACRSCTIHPSPSFPERPGDAASVDPLIGCAAGCYQAPARKTPRGFRPSRNGLRPCDGVVPSVGAP